MAVALPRRKFLELTTLTAAAAALPSRSLAGSEASVRLFDGRTLAGWEQLENNAIAFTSSAISDPAGLLQALAHGTDPLAVSLRPKFATVLAQAAALPAADPPPKAVVSALAHALNDVVQGPSLAGADGIAQVHLRPVTRELLHKTPSGGVPLLRLNKLLLEDTFAGMLAQSVSEGWTVSDGSLTSLGAGRGVIYTTRDLDHFRITFTMRHVSGNPDHQACVLLFCTRPGTAGKPLDALGGIQFQVPNGGHWDYRPGRNNGGGPAFTRVTETHFDPHEWSRVEIVANARTGTAQMAVAQPVGRKGVHVLDFNDPAAGKAGPFALQMHNAGLIDQYKDLSVEENPASDALLLPG